VSSDSTVLLRIMAAISFNEITIVLDVGIDVLPMDS
jgi:hypothetical protein